MFYISVKLIGEHCYWLLAFGYWLLAVRVQSLEFRVQSLEFRVQSSKFKVQTNKSAAMPSAKSIPSSVRMKLLSFTNIIPESKYFLTFFKKL